VSALYWLVQFLVVRCELFSTDNVYLGFGDGRCGISCNLTVWHFIGHTGEMVHFKLLCRRGCL